MKHYLVQITSKALDDMDGIYNYIVTQLMAPETAMEQYNRIAEAYMRLRQIIIDNYSVFYIIRDDKVIVTRVLYSSSDISKKL